MTETQTLLDEYARSGSETAFRELVSRYINLVYSTAVRAVEGDTHLAEDITQTVFVHLARNANRVPEKVMLGGWLHRDTCNVASKMLRSARRRQARETHAVQMNAVEDHSQANLEQIAPALDEAINDLEEEDRTAILLRFFEQLDFRSVGETLGTTEEAARKRVSRALEKLSVVLKRRGVSFSAAGLGTALAAETVKAAPAGLAAGVSTSALAAAAGSGFVALLKSLSLAKVTIGMTAAMALAGLFTIIVIRQARSAAQSAYAGTTHVGLSGTAGAVFSGFYVQDGQRIVVSNALPWSVDAERVSEFEFHKTKRDDVVLFDLRYDSASARATQRQTLGPDLLWLRGRVENGLVTELHP